MAVASIINVVDDWNKQMVLPAGMHEIEVQMRAAMENSAKLQTDLFSSTTTLSGLLLNLLIIALVAAAAEIYFPRTIQGFYSA